MSSGPTQSTDADAGSEGVNVDIAPTPHLETERFVDGSLLGQGGMGTVYRVVDRELGRPVALKRLTRPAETDEPLFQREFYILKQLQHPRIVQAYEYGIDPHGLYYTMELLDGSDLRDVASLGVRRVCELLRDIASALAMLHSRQLVHRDLSAHNVRCTADGRAKLIDFGAMMPFGIANRVIGTAPFIAPEALHRQPLDGRADLYALGILAYWLLTGRHAYEARSSSQLLEAWHTPPPSVAALVPEVPDPLADLVMALISLSVTARPRSATEVIDKLTAVADLPPDAELEVQQAYLTTPKLVGRLRHVRRFRRYLRAVQRDGQGETLWIEGAWGSGRSRMLAELALEAELSGCRVLRLDGGQCLDGELAGARVLAEELLQGLPAEARRVPAALEPLALDVARRERDSWRPRGAASSVPPDGEGLGNTLFDWFRTELTRTAVVVVVDDVARVDTASQALLARLARSAGREPWLVAVTSVTASPPDGPLSLLRHVAEPLKLEPLEQDQVHSLLASIFGEVPHLARVARHINEVAAGNPRTLLQLAQFLVDEGLARYQGGEWQLPAQLGKAQLPDGYVDALTGKFLLLSEAARELAAALALCDDLSLSERDQFELLREHSASTVRRAVAELETARVLEAPVGPLRLAHAGWAQVAIDSLPRALRRDLHGRLARIARTHDHVFRVAWHLLHAGDHEQGISALLEHTDRTLKDEAYAARMIHLASSRDPLVAYELALQACEQHERPARESLWLRLQLVAAACRLTDEASISRHVPPIIDQLRHDCGLDIYDTLPSEMEHDARLKEALARASARYEATPEHVRVYTVMEAITGVASLVYMLVSCGLVTFAVYWIEQARKLIAPLCGLSPRLQFVADGALAALMNLRGDWPRSRKLAETLLEELSRGAAQSPVGHHLACGFHYSLGQTAAFLGLRDAFRHADALESEPSYAINAWRVRYMAHLSFGEIDQARSCLDRAESLSLQTHTQQMYDAVSVASEAHIYAVLGDAIGLRRLLPTLEQRARRYERWRPLWRMHLGRYRSLCGDHPRALEECRRALAEVAPGTHPSWPSLVALHMDVLVELGDFQRARAAGIEALEQARRADIALTARIEQSLALAEALSGESAQARRRADDVIAFYVDLGSGGAVLGSAYETRARIAILTGDESGFEVFAEHVCAEWPIDHNPVLAARYEKLLHQARAAGFDPPRDSRTEVPSQTQVQRRTEATLEASTETTAERSEDYAPAARSRRS